MTFQIIQEGKKWLGLLSPPPSPAEATLGLITTLSSVDLATKMTLASVNCPTKRMEGKG